MTEHVHEWDAIKTDEDGDIYIFCAFKGCKAKPDVDYVIEIFTEYPKLKNATERLSAEDARMLYHGAPQRNDEDYRRKDALFDYADILEKN